MPSVRIRLAKEVAEVVDRPGRAEKLRLDREGQAHPEPRAVAEMVQDLIRQVVEVDGRLGHAVAGEQSHQSLDERHPGDGDHGLGHGVGQGPQPGAAAGGQDQCLGDGGLGDGDLGHG